MKYYFILICFTFNILALKSQDIKYSVTYCSKNTDFVVESTSDLKDGSLIVLGEVFNRKDTFPGPYANFIAKINPNGNLGWIKTFESKDANIPLNVTELSNNSIIIEYGHNSNFEDRYLLLNIALNGDIKWSKFDTKIFDIVNDEKEKNFYSVTNKGIYKFDYDCKPIYFKSFDFFEFREKNAKSIIHNDEIIFFSGNYKDKQAKSNSIIMSKFDKNANFKSAYEFRIKDTLNIRGALAMKEGIILYGYLGDIFKSNRDNKGFIIYVDYDFNIKWSKRITNSTNDIIVTNVNQFGDQKLLVTTALNLNDSNFRNDFLITKIDLKTALADTTYLHNPRLTKVQGIEHCDGVDMDNNYFFSRDVVRGFHVFKSNKNFKVRSCNNTTTSIKMNDIVIEKEAFSFNTIDQNTPILKDKIFNFDTLKLVKYDMCSDCGCPFEEIIEQCENEKYISPWSGKIFEFNMPTLDTIDVRDGCYELVEKTIKPIKQKVAKTNRDLCKVVPFVKIGSKTYTKAGIYQDTLKSVGGCDSILTTNIKDLSVSLGEDREIFAGDNVKLEVKSSNGNVFNNYTWLPKGTSNCDTCQSIIVAPSQNQWYSVKVIGDGCVVRDTVLIKVLNQKLVYMPTAFSPNEDNINDLYRPYCAEGVAEIDYFRIYDRWGTLIYTINNYDASDTSIGWNGTFKDKPANRDVYTYAVQVRLRNGQTQQYLGDVFLSRE